MSDKPLFQHLDETEAVHAPEQLPDGQADETPVVVPTAGLAGSGLGSMGGTSGMVGTSTGIAPAAGPVGLKAETEDEHTTNEHS